MPWSVPRPVQADPAAVIRAAATLAAGAFREGAAFPAVVGLPVAVALRGAGDGDFESGPAAYYQSDPRRGGKVLWRDRLRARANLDAGRSIADFYRCRHCARAALAAHRVYLDDRCPHSLAAGDRVSGTGDVAMSPARAGRTDAAEGAPRRRLSARHGAVRQPRPRKQQDPVGGPYFCFTRGALRTNYRRYRYCRTRAAGSLAGSRGRLDCPHAKWPCGRRLHCRDRYVRGGASAAFSPDLAGPQ